MDWANILGAFGSACSIGSFVPQAWKVFRTGETRALSLPMYVLTVTGFAFWTAYGLVVAAWPLILTNGVCLTYVGVHPHHEAAIRSAGAGGRNKLGASPLGQADRA